MEAKRGSVDEPSNDKRLPKQTNFVLDYLRDFTGNSSLHGLKYIGEPSTFIVEKLFRFAVFTLSVVVSGFLIKNLWTKWTETPVIVTFGESLVPVWEVPFPAITICGKNKIWQKRYLYDEATVDSYVGSTMTETEFEKFEDLSLTCPIKNDLIDKFVNINATRIYGNSSIVDNIVEVAPKLEEAITYCEWREEFKATIEYGCTLFSQVLTNKGVCYTFNGLSAEDMYRKDNVQKEYSYTNETGRVTGWSLERGYSPDIPLDHVYPRRGRDYGLAADLRLVLNQEEGDLNLLCEGPLRGYEVLLHNPAEKPRLFRYQFEVAAGVEMNVAITMNVETSTTSLKNYDSESRQCYFPTERYLRYFKFYTETNCEEECRANYTDAMCGCVAYYMPHKSSRICTLKSHECVKKAKEVLATHRMAVNLFKTKGSPIITKDDKERTLIEVVKRCNCMPTCTTITFDSDRNSADNNIDLWSLAVTNQTQYEPGYFKSTIINFYFKETRFKSVRRSELYGPTDFLANCGGLLGLFLGFSVLSLVEIVYYMSIRLCSVLIGTSRLTVASENSKPPLEITQ